MSLPSLISYNVACKDGYPKNYWKACSLSCKNLKSQNGCDKKWSQILKGTCKTNVPKWHHGQYVNQYCKRTCEQCSMEII